MKILKRQMLVFFLAAGSVYPVFAGSENCQNKTLKGLEEITQMVVESGVGQVYLIESPYYPATLKMVFKGSDGKMRKTEFSGEILHNPSTVWKRLPEFDYGDSSSSINFSCGYGDVNYKLAFQVGNSALCYMHNPGGTVLNKKGQLVACLIVAADIEEVLNQVKLNNSAKFK